MAAMTVGGAICGGWGGGIFALGLGWMLATITEYLDRS
jgi:hypothetical protein